MTDDVHLIPLTFGEGTTVNDLGALLFSDDDGEFGLRAYFVAPNGAEAAARVYSADGRQLLYEYRMIVACPTQPLCRVATDLALHLGGGGTWSIALEHIEGVIYDWQVEIYRDDPAGLPTTGTGRVCWRAASARARSGWSRLRRWAFSALGCSGCSPGGAGVRSKLIHAGLPGKAARKHERRP